MLHRFLTLILCLLPIHSWASTWWSRIDADVEWVEQGRPGWMVETIQPLPLPYVHEDQLLFIQARAAHRHRDQTYNLGLGYRALLFQNHWLLGINGFGDWSPRLNYRRYSVGIELLGPCFSFRGNLYDTLSGRKKLETADFVTISERSLDGYDLEFNFPLPYFPWIWVSGTGFHWKGHSMESFRGFEMSAWCHLTPNLSLQLGKSFDNYRSQSFLRLEFRACLPRRIPCTLWWGGAPPCDLSYRLLEKVQRHHDLVIERRVAGGSGIIIGRGA